MKKQFYLSMMTLLSPFLLLASCSKIANADEVDVAISNDVSFENEASDTSADVNSGDVISSDTFTGSETTKSFSIETSDGTYSQDGDVYTISAYGSYTLKGKLTGQIVVDVAETEAGESTVELELNNVSITYGSNSPILIKSADEVKIKSKKSSYNVIRDTRANKTVDDENQGEGAINAKCDLKFAGPGTLIVEANYNQGIHSSDDLKIQKSTIKVTAYGHALKGSDSFTLVSGNVLAISQTADGVKTSNSTISSKGKQKGNITIYGGTLNVLSQTDGLDAAYNVNIYNGVDEDDSSIVTVPSVTIYTDKYATSMLSSYTSSLALPKRPGPGGPGGGGPGGPGGFEPGNESNTDKSATTAKGIKAANDIVIKGGSIFMKCYDDGIHANYGEVIGEESENRTSTGDVTMAGGNTTIYASDDGIHADRYLYLQGGVCDITYSYEGYEGNQINVTGGDFTAVAKDDGMNAGDGSAGLTPNINVSGGLVKVWVSPNGDTDGIDSNGDYNQTGGVVFVGGPSSNNASSLDVGDNNNKAYVKGGTLVAFGKPAASISRGEGVSYTTKTGSLSGNKNVTIGDESYALALPYTYSSAYVYSASSVTIA